MKISFSHVQEEIRVHFEQVTERHVAKLERLLKRYAPDLVQLHGVVEKHPRKNEYKVALNLVLPTGTLHATGSALEVRHSAKTAFTELESQVIKHQARLRKDYEWKRKRLRGAELRGAPASD